MRESTHRGLRLALASLIAVALAAQLLIGLSRDSGLTVVRFFSYFTVLSNTTAVVMLTMLAARPDRISDQGFSTFRGGVTVYMSVTGLVYAVILAPMLVDVAVPEPWIDWTIHVIGPVAVALDWIFEPPPLGVAAQSVWIWLAFPAGYFAYSLVRGPLVDWYPYPFLDPADSGYGAVAITCGVVLAVIGLFSIAYFWWANRRPVPARPA